MTRGLARRRTWSTGSSRPKRPTARGWPTSSTCRLCAVSSAWPSSWTSSAPASSVGRWLAAPRAELVVAALNMAGAQRRPGKGVVHPSDGGSQHSSLQVREALPRGRDQALHGLGRRPPRQRHGRELLRQPRKRTARPKRLPETRRGKKGAYIVKALARDRGSRSVDSALERRERCAPQLRIGPAAVRIPLAPSKREKPAPRPISISRRGEGPAATAKHRLPLRPGSGIAVVRGPGPAACPLASPRGRFQAHTPRGSGRSAVVGPLRASAML